jgi:hypothetical protein
MNVRGREAWHQSSVYEPERCRPILLAERIPMERRCPVTSRDPFLPNLVAAFDSFAVTLIGLIRMNV